MYETDTGSLSTTLSGAGLDQSIIDAIIALTTGTAAGGGGGGIPGGGSSTVEVETVDAGTGGVVTVGAGTDVLFVHGSDTGPTSFTVPGNVPVIVFEGNGGVNVVVGGGANGADRVVLGSDGNDKIIITDGTNTEVVLGSGDSTVTGGTGSDTIVGGQGNSTVTGGGGHDILVIHGTHGDYVIVVNHVASAPSGNAEASTTGHVVVTNSVTGEQTDITGIQYVQLDGTDAMVFAASTVEAGVATLYQAAFGRTGEFGGVEFWFDQAKGGESLHDIAVAFTNSAEFASHTAGLSDTAFVQQLYQDTFSRSADSGGLDFWVHALQSGSTRADLLTAFASVAAMNEAGTLHTEATIVGSVTIVQDIV
jgi:Ca2+-binding RTX toxin-like protein